MNKERVLDSQDIQAVYDGAAKRKAVDPFDWPWQFFALVMYVSIGLCIAFLMGWL